MDSSHCMLNRHRRRPSVHTASQTDEIRTKRALRMKGRRTGKRTYQSTFHIPIRCFKGLLQMYLFILKVSGHPHPPSILWTIIKIFTEVEVRNSHSFHKNITGKSGDPNNPWNKYYSGKWPYYYNDWLFIAAAKAVPSGNRNTTRKCSKRTAGSPPTSRRNLEKSATVNKEENLLPFHRYNK